MWIQNLHRRIWGRTGGGAGFIVDFYCHKAGLVIEVDGDVHDLQKDEDARRDKTLREMGLRIVRFRNEEIVRNLSAVLGKIIELTRLLQHITSQILQQPDKKGEQLYNS